MLLFEEVPAISLKSRTNNTPMQLPYQRFSLVTHKSMDDVALLLLRSIPPSDRSKDPGILNMQKYTGSVWQDSFTLYPNINVDNPASPWIARTNPFVPLFRGILKPLETGTLIQIQPYPELGRFLITQFFFALLILPAALDAYRFVTGKAIQHIDLTFIFTLIALGMLLVMLRTIFEETKRFKDFLFRAVGAKDIKKHENA